MPIPLEQISEYRFRVAKQKEMRTDGILYASRQMIPSIECDNATVQLANIATLPGIVGNALAMPDIHWGYGFPIGGVAAFDMDKGVISPGGIGYDINCGVRVLRTNLLKEDIKKIDILIAALFSEIPSGVGEQGKLCLSTQELKRVLEKGAQWAVSQGYGTAEELDHIEEKGMLSSGDFSVLSKRAIERGKPQLGTLGSGNHFLEIQYVSEIFDEKIASVFGLMPGQVMLMIHTGSRGLGYQVCDDYLRIMNQAVRKYGIILPDRQLACAPVNSNEGQAYFAAMSAAANYAWANRQCIAHWARRVFEKVLNISPRELGMQTLYDVSHNIGKIEKHIVSGKNQEVFIHRKGATRAFAGQRDDVPAPYRQVGQPVLIPGTMGTSSHILVGTQKAMQETFGSVCHGAGRILSRSQATKQATGKSVLENISKSGIYIKPKNLKTLAEEAPFAYKDVDQVVNVCHNAGIAHRVARLVPIGVIKP